jgi:hypothetical protein
MTRGFKSYRDLEVWQKAMSVAKMVYLATADLPGVEKLV